MKTLNEEKENNERDREREWQSEERWKNVRSGRGFGALTRGS